MLSLNLKFILPAILLVLTVNGATVTPSPVATKDLPCADGVHVSPDGHAVAVSPEHAVYFLPAKFAYSEEPRAYISEFAYDGSTTAIQDLLRFDGLELQLWERLRQRQRCRESSEDVICRDSRENNAIQIQANNHRIMPR
ncbi:hypothetical protein C8J56DRAFT_1025906 [Mycena floridula]|nr:hypothetical protein C8J56DRAFT_1025906 [Mycena floridula]